jgi:hypothetical protein
VLGGVGVEGMGGDAGSVGAGHGGIVGIGFLTVFEISAPVTSARRPCRSRPETTSSAVEEKPNGEVVRVVLMLCPSG